jgi:hypothetical protein
MYFCNVIKDKYLRYTEFNKLKFVIIIIKNKYKIIKIINFF